MKKVCIFVLSITQKPNNMTSQITIESEMKRRTDLIENEDFRKLCIEAAQKLGITAQEWNENKAMLLFFFANQMCGIENKMN